MLGETEKSSDVCRTASLIVRDGSRTESGNEFHSDVPETEKLKAYYSSWRDQTLHKGVNRGDTGKVTVNNRKFFEHDLQCN